jgi:ribosomal protein L11 methyltransferase
VTERRVIDVGTGSGVIAIAAAKLGAASVLAIDRDRDALSNARENVERNGESDIVEVREQDLAVFAGRSADADVVVANLTAAAIQQHARTLAGLMASEGALILGGFAPDELAQIERAFGAAAGESRAQEGWAAACFTRLPKGT